MLAVHIRPSGSGSNAPYVAGLLSGLCGLDPEAVQVKVFANQWLPEWPAHGPGTPLTFRRVRMPPLGTQLARLVSEWWLAARLTADVAFFPGTSAAPFSRAPQVSFVHWDNRLQPHSAPGMRHVANSMIMRLIRWKATRVIVPTSAYADFLASAWGFDHGRLAVIPHGVAIPHGLQPPDRASRKGVVAVLNDLPHKNLDVLLQAWSRVAPREAPPTLTLIGPVSEASLDRADVDWRRWEATGQLVRVHQLTHADVLDAIATARLLVSPSESETFCMPLAEAMAVGTPVIAADTAVAREVCGEAACFVAARDAGAFAAAISRLYCDASSQDHLRELGLARARPLTWTDAAGALTNVLATAADGGTAVRAAPSRTD